MARASALRLGILSLVWGSSFLFIKVGLEGLSPAQIALARVSAGCVVLAAAVVLGRRRLPTDARLWAHLAAVAVFGNVVPFFLFGWGEERINSGLAGVLNATTPLFTVAVASALLPEEGLTRQRAAGLLVGFVGVLVVAAPWEDGPAGAVSGQLACLAAAGCYGLAFAYTRRFVAHSDHPPAVLATVQLGWAAVILGAALPLVGTDPVRLRPSVVAAVVTLGVVGTGFAYLLFYALVRDEGATTAAMSTYLLPLVAVALGAAVRGEAVGWNVVAGGPVIFLGVALVEGRIGARRTAPRGSSRPRSGSERRTTCSS